MKLFALFRTSLSCLSFSLLLVPLEAPALSPIPLVTMATKQAEQISSIELANQFIDFLNSGDYEQARSLLHPDLQSVWSTEAIEKLWLDLIENTGELQQRLESRSTETIEAELVFIDVEFAQGKEQFLVTLNQNQQIIGIDFPRYQTIEEISEEVVTALLAEDFARVRGYLHPYLKTELFPQDIEAKWRRLLTLTGPYQSNLGMEVQLGSEVDNVDVVTVNLQFEKVVEKLIIIFNHQKQIIGIDFPRID